MGIFSEELRILDRNTVQLMIDEMQDEVNALSAERNTLSAERDTLSAERDTLSAECDTLSAERDTLSAERDTLSAECDTLHAELVRINQLNRKLAEQGRTEDIMKAASDVACRKKLYDEFVI